MWTVNSITNNYDIDVALNYTVMSGATIDPANFPPLGDERTIALNIPYKGIVYFKDIGEDPLGPSEQTYGVLITYNALHWVFRYDDQGKLNITVNADGTLALSSPNGGTIYPITLTSFSGYMQTYTENYYVYATNGGGHGAGENVPIRTDATTIGDYELFTVVWTDIAAGKFALMTPNMTNYVGVIGGGNKGGEDPNLYPIQTDATTTIEDGLFHFEIQENGKYAVKTSNGNYLTAVNGGGWAESTNTYPIMTIATVIGGWERQNLIPEHIPEE
jgi:hypothetical protein